METSLKTGFAQIFSCCPKNLSCPNFGGAAVPLAPPARTPMEEKWIRDKRTPKDLWGEVTPNLSWNKMLLFIEKKHINTSSLLQQ